jgi:ABC-type transport system involved in cytochrome c biogenesis permease subunit
MIRHVSIAIVSLLATGVTCLAQDEPLRKHAALQVNLLAGVPAAACRATAATLIVSASMPPYGRRACMRVLSAFRA